MPCGKTIAISEHLKVVYIGIRYSRLVDNEEVSVVLSFEPQTGKLKPEPTMDFYALLSLQA
jgi:hypothetical protein